MRNRLLIIATISLATLLATQCTYTPTPIHYRFVLPDNYMGWVRIDFGVPSAPDWTFSNLTTTVTIPETGVEQTGSVFLSTPEKGEEIVLYYYRDGDLVPVPEDLYDHSLFASTLVLPFKPPKKSAPARPKGSWYFFVGPASLRGRFPPRGVLHHGAKVPTPGRITVPEAKPQPSL
ncbi:MAG: hypothetical protein WAN23_12515 [Candidatus Acidiferrales bacterium]